MSGHTTIGTPEQFDAQLDAADALREREEAIVARVAALDAPTLTALRAHCILLGADVAELEAEERVIGTRPAWLVATTVLGVNAGNSGAAYDDAAYTAGTVRVLDAIAAWLGAHGR